MVFRACCVSPSNTISDELRVNACLTTCGGKPVDFMVKVEKLTLGDGSIFLGNALDSQPSGYGMRTFLDGSSYEGQFLNGKMHGRGILRRASGSMCIGTFQDDTPHGDATYISSQGSLYEGEFYKGEMTGRGVLTLADGSVYHGSFVNGKLHGDGGGHVVPEAGIVVHGLWEDGNYIKEQLQG